MGDHQRISAVVCPIRFLLFLLFLAVCVYCSWHLTLCLSVAILLLVRRCCNRLAYSQSATSIIECSILFILSLVLPLESQSSRVFPRPFPLLAHDYYFNHTFGAVTIFTTVDLSFRVQNCRSESFYSALFGLGICNDDIST